MEKTIKIGDQSVTLNNNIGWALDYRSQFGSDIIPALMPLLAGALDIVSGLINETGKTEDIELSDLAKLADGDALLNAAIHLGGFELADFINITWALAKSANEEIPEPRVWVSQFEIFPIDEIAPEVFKLIFKGVVSSKNLRRLEDLKKKIQPALTSIQSFSPDSSED